MNGANRIKVLYIGGSHRSGSTLLEKMLSHLDGVVACGELKSIWMSGFIEDLLCGCGERFKSCEFWSRVIEEGFGQKLEDKAELDRVAMYAKEFSSTRRLMRLGRQILKEHLDDYESNFITPLYSAIRDVSGANIIVDPSNVSWYLRVLDQCPSIDLYLVHLVRDSRAVAYSYKRKKIRPEFGIGKQEFTPIHSIWTSIKHWLVNNHSTMKTGKALASGRYMILGYDEMVSSPRETLRRVLSFAGIPDSGLRFFDGDHTVRFSPTHSILGNPIRFSTGPVTIKNDNEWTRKMKLHDYLLTTAITYPLQRKLKAMIRESGQPE